MAARIQSLRNGVDPIDDASRNDLVSGDIVTVTALDAATTYNWAIVFAPQSPAGVPSTATFTGDVSMVSPGTFTVDNEGAYLVRLIVDAGLASESTQYVRLRALTASLNLQLVAAGERRDTTGIIPVDVSIEGWANEQNFNLQALEAAAIAAKNQVYHFALNPTSPSYTYQGWVSETCVLKSVTVYLTSFTVGTCTFGVRNVETGNIVLSGGALYDLETTPLGTVTNLPLVAAGDPDLVFDPTLSNGQWDVELNAGAGWDGTNIFVQLVFGVA
jgi:hypothetical protein